MEKFTHVLLFVNLFLHVKSLTHLKFMCGERKGSNFILYRAIRLTQRHLLKSPSCPQWFEVPPLLHVKFLYSYGSIDLYLSSLFACFFLTCV